MSTPGTRRPDGGHPGSRHPDTRQRILDIAAGLFARQGYTATTITDIARKLGTTTAALYYHFPSKAAILAGLLTGPMAAYERLLESIDSGAAGPEDMLAAIIDMCAESGDVAIILDRDPAAQEIIEKQLPRSSREIIADTVAALAGPDPDRAALIRANAAFAVAKSATMAAVDLGGGVLSAADRAEVLAAALRTLHKELSVTDTLPPLPVSAQPRGREGAVTGFRGAHGGFAAHADKGAA